MTQAPAGTSTSYEMRYLNEDVELIVGARPAALVENSQLKELYETLGTAVLEKIKQTLGVNANEIEQAVAGIGFPKQK